MSHRHRRAQYLAPTPAPVAVAPLIAAPRPQLRHVPDDGSFWRHEVQAHQLRKIAEAQAWALSESMYRSLHRDDPPPPAPAPIDRMYHPPTFEPYRWSP